MPSHFAARSFTSLELFAKSLSWCNITLLIYHLKCTRFTHLLAGNKLFESVLIHIWSVGEQQTTQGQDAAVCLRSSAKSLCH